jgi:hypothetical protein
VSFILDIDLDYFDLLPKPLERLNEMLTWSGRPVDAIVQHHHQAFEHWIEAVRVRRIAAPDLILHVDAHHDMLGDRRPVGPGNFLYFAMRRWPRCRVRWLTDLRIDSPDMWLSEGAWRSVTARFRCVGRFTATARKPDLVTVCTSPGFANAAMRRPLLEVAKMSNSPQHQA